MLDGLIDIYLPDFKYYSSYYSERYSRAPDYFDVTVDAIDEMVRQTAEPVIDADGLMRSGTIIRHLMLPNLGSDTAHHRQALGHRGLCQPDAAVYTVHGFDRLSRATAAHHGRSVCRGV